MLLDVEKLIVMRDEVRGWTVRKGWRENAEVPERTMGEDIALLHSELAEATEAFRLHGLERWYVTPKVVNPREVIFLQSGSCDYAGSKPEGVGSELADTLIRLLDNYAEHNLVPTPHVISGDEAHQSVGDDLSALHALVGDIHIKWYFDGVRNDDVELRRRILKSMFDKVLSVLIFVAFRYEFDLAAEYRAKMDYNETRSMRHGGKLL